MKCQVIRLSLEVLIHDFILTKKQLPKHANELLDYLQIEYLLGNLSINHYKPLLQELYLRGATKPNQYSF